MSEKYVKIAAIIGIIACVGDFLFLFVFASYEPGYNHLKDTMSSLGASASPVSTEISVWWIIMGFLFIFFGIGFRFAFSRKNRYALIASFLIITYGMGEGIGSGVFKADRLAEGLSTSAIIHDIVGGIGVVTILLLPLIMLKVIPKNLISGFHKMSVIIFIIGIVTLMLFMFRFIPSANEFIATYKGLWQRLFVFNNYFYLITIAVIILTHKNIP